MSPSVTLILDAVEGINSSWKDSEVEVSNFVKKPPNCNNVSGWNIAFPPEPESFYMVCEDLNDPLWATLSIFEKCPKKSSVLWFAVILLVDFLVVLKHI